VQKDIKKFETVSSTFWLLARCIRDTQHQTFSHELTTSLRIPMFRAFLTDNKILPQNQLPSLCYKSFVAYLQVWWSETLSRPTDRNDVRTQISSYFQCIYNLTLKYNVGLWSKAAQTATDRIIVLFSIHELQAMTSESRAPATAQERSSGVLPRSRIFGFNSTVSTAYAENRFR
jgi:hypothetical protein